MSPSPHTRVTRESEPERQSPMEEDVFDSIADDPVGAAKEIRKDDRKLWKGFRAKLYYLIARAYAVADEMLTNEGAWKKFIEDEFWKTERKKRPGMDSRSEPLLHVMVFVFSTGTYDRAWKYAKALESHFNDRVPPHCIEAVIKQEGGIEKMVRAANGHHSDGAEAETKPKKALANHTSREEKKQSPKRKEVKATQPRASGKTIPPKTIARKSKPRQYRFIATKKCGPGLRRLTEGQKARMTVKMVERHGELFPRVIDIEALKPSAR